MLAIRLDVETERRLEALAKRTGRTKTFYAREAIAAHLDALEDFYLAEERLRLFRDGDQADRAVVIDLLQRLWARGEASGATIDGNFDAGEIARLAATRAGD